MSLDIFEIPSPSSARVLRRIRLFSPAKINLHLGISTQICEGYHNLETVFHTIDLHDELLFELCEEGDPAGPSITLVCQPGLNLPLEQNLIYKAICAYAHALGRPLVNPGEHLRITLTKKIPAQAGLGGGSSNAAAALLAAARLWGEDPLAEPCLRVAGLIGADVAFFLYGGCAYMSGKGEILRERFMPLEMPLLLVNTGEGVSTKAAYQLFDEMKPRTQSIQALLDVLRESDANEAAVSLASNLPSNAKAPVCLDARASRVAPLLFNNLEDAAISLAPSIARERAWLQRQEEVRGVLVSGSGSAQFAVCPCLCSAKGLEQIAIGRGVWACATHTTATGVRIVDDETLAKS